MVWLVSLLSKYHHELYCRHTAVKIAIHWRKGGKYDISELPTEDAQPNCGCCVTLQLQVYLLLPLPVVVLSRTCWKWTGKLCAYLWTLIILSYCTPMPLLFPSVTHAWPIHRWYRLLKNKLVPWWPKQYWNVLEINVMIMINDSQECITTAAPQFEWSSAKGGMSNGKDHPHLTIDLCQSQCTGT